MDRFEPGIAHHTALWETVAVSLRHAIILGALAPGVHLEEPALAAKFGISRIPVREALTRLEQEGLVRLERRRGAFVIGVGDQDIGDIYDCRRVIEVYAIRLASTRIEAPSLRDLTALVREMDEAIRKNQPQRMAQPDMEFHRQIIVHSGNHRLVAAWNPMAGLLQAILSITNTNFPDMPTSVRSHQDMVEALAAHDADAAERLLREHLASGEGTLREALRRVKVNTRAWKDGIATATGVSRPRVATLAEP